MVSYNIRLAFGANVQLVLILIVVDNGLVRLYNKQHSTNNRVLILIVVDNGLVQGCKKDDESDIESLNPYCSGQWSRTNQIKAIEPCDLSLNPYCSGQWSRT